MTSGKVRLRPLRREDRDRLYGWLVQRDLVTRSAPFRPVGEIEHEQWLESMLQRRSDMVIFGIETIDSAELIGTCQLLNIHPVHHNAELRIRIGSEEHRGEGCGTEAVRLLIDVGFRDLNLHRIYLHVFATNEPAIRSYAKCGFQKEGTMSEAAYIDGSWVDVVVMGLTRNSHA